MPRIRVYFPGQSENDCMDGLRAVERALKTAGLGHLHGDLQPDFSDVFDVPDALLV